MRAPFGAAAGRGGPAARRLTPYRGMGCCAGCPVRFWVYAAAALLYGIVEMLNGNWPMLYLMRQPGAAASCASLALTAFWAMVTAGRLLASLVSTVVPSRRIYLGTSALTTLTLLIVARVRTPRSAWLD